MLGRGCPYQDYCNACSNKFNNKTYCNNSNNGEAWKDCPERPLNEGNKEVMQKHMQRKTTSSNTHLGLILVFAVIACMVLSRIFN